MQIVADTQRDGWKMKLLLMSSKHTELLIFSLSLVSHTVTLISSPSLQNVPSSSLSHLSLASQQCTVPDLYQTITITPTRQHQKSFAQVHVPNLWFLRWYRCASSLALWRSLRWGSLNCFVCSGVRESYKGGSDPVFFTYVDSWRCTQ